MKQIIFVFSLIMGSLVSVHGQEFEQNITGPVTSTTQNMVRSAQVGIGFTAPVLPTYPAAGVARFIVRNGILAHYGDLGSVGDLSNSTWAGLGLGNPSPGSPNPYGLAVTRLGSVGFFNLIPAGTINGGFAGTLGQDLIAGFGSGTGTAENRFILRSYNNAGTQPLDFKNLLVANPRGAVGINNEPFAAFSVDTRRAAQGGVLAGGPLLPDAIAIQGEQPFPPDNSGFISTSSGMGNQANNSLALSGVAVEGTRAQIPSFVLNPVTTGIAVNLQAVFDPNGGPVAPATIPALIPLQNKEYAELSWQDGVFNGQNFNLNSIVGVTEKVAPTIGAFGGKAR